VRVVVQRVTSAAVTVDGAAVGAIGPGLLLLAGFTAGDGAPQVHWMADKLADLRIFSDEQGKMNRDIRQAGGSLLVVSQFTLYGDAQQGRRPSFVAALAAVEAEPLYASFLVALRAKDLTVQAGVFGAMMQVSLVNDGPVTLLLER
jgi:D-tyrosyl-tRNA(Tyr) deacylase